MRPIPRTALGLLILALALCSDVSHADSNLYVLSGTMTSCGCQYFPTTADWICFASFQEAAPAPHFGPSNLTTVSAELVEQGIGQCGAMQATLPRKVQMLFWLEAAGLDYVHGIVRSAPKGYYLIDLGPVTP